MAWAFRFLEEIALADIAFEAEGDSIEEAFEVRHRRFLRVWRILPPCLGNGSVRSN